MTDALALLIKIVKRVPHLLDYGVIQKALGEMGLQALKNHLPRAAELLTKLFPEEERQIPPGRPKQLQ